MSELINKTAIRKNFQWQLLTTVSALALLGAAYGTSQARADDDSDRPTVWIELGGQLSRLNDAEEAFSPSLMDGRSTQFSPFPNFEKMPQTSIDEAGSISFQPENSDWVFSAAIRYGRAISKTHVRQQTSPQAFISYRSGNRYAKYPSAEKFADTATLATEHHLIVDFQAGKDVGLGMFGKDSSSIFSLGLRFAQFGANSNIALKSNPDWHFDYKYFSGKNIPLGGTYHTNAATLLASRSFHGIGPSLSWNASAPFMGNGQNSEIALDWGLNAAFLFGRQRANVHYQTTGAYHTAKYNGPHYTKRHTTSHLSTDIPRSRTVMVPNVGGFAGLSFRYANAKVSFGYRADLFFGAMDGGIDKRKSENVGFYGPFANVSVGIGG
ncbi:MAG TPA: hypothetical protein VIJ62_05065 [Rhizomicrobium sp.]